jgi:uncharacterized protein involved in oxidation of intracellular sulfur
MKHLLILNDPPYGTERSFNGLRMAHALAKLDPEGDVTVFLMADAVLCAKAGQKTPEGYYNRLCCTNHLMVEVTLSLDGLIPRLQ